MKYRVLLFFICVVALVLAAYHAMWIQYAGFPDWHLTDLDRARLPLYKAFLFLSIMFALAAAYFGFATPSDKIKGRAITITAAYLFCAGLIAAIDYYLGVHLDHGVGG